jgi:hypothetical protein
MCAPMPSSASPTVESERASDDAKERREARDVGPREPRLNIALRAMFAFPSRREDIEGARGGAAARRR